jgi:hypothetical protein
MYFYHILFCIDYKKNTGKISGGISYLPDGSSGSAVVAILFVWSYELTRTLLIDGPACRSHSAVILSETTLDARSHSFSFPLPQARLLGATSAAARSPPRCHSLPCVMEGFGRTALGQCSLFVIFRVIILSLLRRLFVAPRWVSARCFVRA